MSTENRSIRGGTESFNDRKETESDKDTFYKKPTYQEQQHPYQLPQKTPAVQKASVETQKPILSKATLQYFASPASSHHKGIGSDPFNQSQRSEEEINRSESRGSLPGVQNLNYAIRNNSQDYEKSSTASIKSGYPMIEEEYKQPTYEDYYGNKQQALVAERIDPFPGVRDSRDPRDNRDPRDQRDMRDARDPRNGPEQRERLAQPSLNSQRHLRDIPLGTVSEEAELNYTRGDTPKDVPFRHVNQAGTAKTLEEYHRAN